MTQPANIAPLPYESVLSPDLAGTLAPSPDAMPAPAPPPTVPVETTPGRVSIVTRDGTLGTVPEEKLSDALRAGATIATAKQIEETRVREVAQESLGAFTAPVAAATGLASGLTLGLSNWGIKKAAGLLGADEAHVADVLSGAAGEHEILHAGAELAGNIAPVLLSGGGAAAAEGAAAAAGKAGAGALARGTIRTLGAPVRAATALGEGAAELAAKAIGQAGEKSFLRRVGTQVLKGTISGGVEGMAYGGGAAISDAALGNHDLTAEELLASMGGAAMFGAGLGGISAAPFAVGGEAVRAAKSAGKALGEGAHKAMAKGRAMLEEAGGEVAEAAADATRAGGFIEKVDKHVSDFMRKFMDVEAMSDEQAARSTYARKEFVKNADKRLAPGPDGEPGGWQGVGRILKDTKVIDTEAGVLMNAMTPEQTLERIKNVHAETGQALGDLVKDSKAFVKVGDAAQALEKEIAQYRGKMGMENYVASAEALRDSFYQAVGAVNDKGRLLIGKQIPIAEFQVQRKALDDLAYREAKSLDPKLRVQIMRDMRGGMKDLERNAILKEGRIDAKAYDKLNRNYQGLSIARDAAEDSISRGGANRSIGLTDYVAFAAGGGGLAGGAMAIANKIARERGSGAASVFLHDLAQSKSLLQAAKKAGLEVSGAASGAAAKLGQALPALGPAGEQIAHAMSKVKDAQLLEEMAKRSNSLKQQIFDSTERIGKATVRGAKLASDVRRVGLMREYANFQNYEQHRKDVESMVSSPEAMLGHVGPQIDGVAAAAPGVAASMAIKSQAHAAFLNETLPPKPTDPYSLTPLAEKKQPRAMTAAEMQWMQKKQIMDHPLSALHGVEDGTLTMGQAETLRTQWPELYSSIREGIFHSVTGRDPKSGPMPRELESKLAILFDVPLRVTQTPQFMAALAPVHAPPEEQPQGGGGSTRGPSKKSLDMPDLSTETQALEAP